MTACKRVFSKTDEYGPDWAASLDNSCPGMVISQIRSQAPFFEGEGSESIMSARSTDREGVFQIGLCKTNLL